MHRLLKLTSLLLCFELILGPVAPGFSFVSKAMAQDCPGGTQFDSTLNRCITTEQMANIMNATSNCSPSDKECYKANAERALKEGEEEGKIKEQLANKGGLMGTGMKVGAVAVPLFLVASRMFKSKSKKPGKCKSMALYMMLGAGAAIFLGDMLANSKHKKRLKKIKEEWEGVRKGEASGDKGSGEKEAEVSTASLAQTSTDPDVRNAQAKESQAEAFEMLAKSEDSLASAAKFKSTVYAIGGLAFAGASVISFMEHFRLMSLKAARAQPGGEAAYQTYYQQVYCTNSTPEAATPTEGTSIENYKIIRKYASLINNSKAAVDVFSLYDNLEDSLRKKQSPSIEAYEANAELAKLNDEKVNKKEILDILKIAGTQLLNQFFISPAHALGNSSQYHENYRPPTSTGNTAASAGSGASTAADAASSAASGASSGAQAAVSAGNAAATSAEGATDLANVAANNTNTPEQLTGLNKFLSSPLSRGIISGVFAAWSGLMFMHAKKQASVSKARAKYLRDRKDEFNDATGAISCTSADRNNVNNLKCYCYTSSGQRNSQRANSQACIALFTGRNVTGETNYLNGTGIASQKVCMTNAGIDENCACRTINTCLSAVPTNFSGINPGTLGLISSSTSPLNQLTSGQIAAGSVNGAAAVSNALKLLDQAKKSQAKVPELANGKGDKLARDMAGSLIASSAGGSAPQLSSPSSGNPFSLSPSQAAASLEKEFKDAESGVASVKSGGFVPQPGSGKVDDFGLEFGMTPTQLAADQNTLSQMNQNLDFGQNDINNSSTTNLFEVLSNRYQRSGMRRLFDDEGKMAADPAAKTDITE